MEPTASRLRVATDAGGTAGAGTDGRRRLAVAMDATPLLGSRTGVGVAVAGMVEAVAGHPDVALTGYGLTATGWRRLPAELPASVRPVRRPLPAGLLLRVWGHVDAPAAECWTGPVDVVHGTNFVVPPTRRAARLVSVYDLTAVVHPELCTPTSRRYPLLIRRAIDSGACVHAVSETVAEEIMSNFSVGPDRVHVVRVGLPALPRAGREARVGPPYVLALGTVEPRKNLPRLVAAFDRVAGKFPDLQLKIAGPPGWGEEALAHALASAVHRERIERLGWVPDTSDLLRSASVFAYPSLYEGFGFPPLEAMAAGVPVVAGATGAIPEICGDAALLVPPTEVDEIAAALEAVMADAALRRRLVERGRLRVQGYSWERAGLELVALYRSLAGR